MYGEKRPEFDPDEVLRNLRGGFDRFRTGVPGGKSLKTLLPFLLVILGLLWGGTGFYTVGPEEPAALRLFGEYRGTEGPGLHWYPPAPIGTRNIEAVLETKTVEIGFRSQPARDVPVEALMITGDLNIVDIQMVVQYRIANLGDFLFSVGDPGDPDRDSREGRPDGRTLIDATESALRQVIGQRSIDDALTSGREAVQEDTKFLLQELVDDYESGLEILQVILQTVRPPDQVRDAFDDVVRARVDKESRINEALAYEQDRIPRELGDAEQVVQAAEGFKAARIARARGEADRFTAILNEYEQSKEVTRQRLYLESIEQVLPNLTLYVFDPEAANGVLPLMQLGPDGSSLASVARGGN